MESLRLAPPPGAIGLVHQNSWVGRRIASKQGVPYSHAIVSIGNSTRNGPEVLDVAPPYARITSYWEWGPSQRKVDWFRFADPLTEEEVRVLRAISHIMNGRIRYDYLALIRLAAGRYSMSDRRPHRMFCTHLVATVLLALRSIDIEGNEQPWNVTPRALAGALRKSPEFRPWAPPVL